LIHNGAQNAGRQGRQPNASYRSDRKTRSRWSLEFAQENNILTVAV
jgi:hypothetical protein